MGIQIKGSNDTISAADGTMTLEGQTLAFTNENITGISTMATGHITGTTTLDDDLKVGISTLFVDKSAGRVGIGTDVPASLLDVVNTGGAAEIICKSSTQPRLMLKTSGTTSECRVDFGDSGDSSRGAIGYNHSDDALKFYTTGVANERLRITSAGDVGISTSTPASKLHLYDSGSDGLIVQSPSGLHYVWAIQAAGNLNNGSLAGELGIRAQSGVSISANNGTGTQLRLTSDGRLRLGASTDEDIHTGEGADLQVVSTDAGGLTFARDDTTVSNGANLGVIRAYGNDNDGTYQEVAKIEFQADLNHGTGDKPGRLVFSTTSDGGSSTTERLRITSAGRVGINETSPDTMLHVRNDNSAAAKIGGQGGDEYYMEIGQLASSSSPGFNATGTNTSMLFQLNGSEKARITSAGLARIQSTDSRGAQELLQLKHINTTTTGDGPAFLLNGEYSSNPWAYAKICSLNSGSGYGADFQIHVHPADGTQGSSVVKALSILGDGAGANVTVTDGNLVIGTSGHGIDFSAAGHATGMTSELFDDYEEGSWTPAPTFSGTSMGGSNNANGGMQGQYTKIGRMVYAWFSVNLDSRDMSLTGSIRIDGLPFSCGQNNWNETGNSGVSQYSGWDNLEGWPQMQVSGANIWIVKPDHASETDNSSHATQAHISASFRIRGQVVYNAT